LFQRLQDGVPPEAIYALVSDDQNGHAARTQTAETRRCSGRSRDIQVLEANPQ